MNQSYLKKLLHIFTTTMIICTQFSYAQPLQKKQRLSNTQKRNLSHIPELSLLREFLDSSLGDFNLTSKFFYNNSIGNRTLLKFSSENFLRQFEKIYQKDIKKTLGQEQKHLILEALRSPVTVQEFIRLTKFSLDPFSKTFEAYLDKNHTWENFLASLLEKNDLISAFLFQEVSQAMLVESLKSEIKDNSFENKFHTNFLMNVFIVYLSSKMEHIQPDHEDSSQEEKNNKKLYVFLHSLMTIISNTRFSAELTAQSHLESSEFEKGIHRLYHWGQPYEARFHTEIHQVIARTPDENYLIQMSYLLSDLLYRVQHDVENQNTNRAQTISDALDDDEIGIRHDHFQWNDLPTPSNQHSIINPMTKNLLQTIYGIHQTFKDSSNEDKIEIMDDIININYQFDTFIDEDHNPHAQLSLIALIKIQKLIHTMIQHQSSHEIKNTICKIKNISYILTDLPANEPLIREKISHALHQQYSHNQTQEQDIARSLSHFDRIMDFDIPLAFKFIFFLSEEKHLLETPKFLEALHSSFTIDQLREAIERHEIRIRVPQAELKSTFSFMYLNSIRQFLKGSFPYHKLFHEEFTKNSDMTHSNQCTLEKHFIKSSLLIQHILHFIYTGQLERIIKNPNRVYSYDPDDPHIPTYLNDFIDLVEDL